MRQFSYFRRHRTCLIGGVKNILWKCTFSIEKPVILFQMTPSDWRASLVVRKQTLYQSSRMYNDTGLQHRRLRQSGKQHGQRRYSHCPAAASVARPKEGPTGAPGTRRLQPGRAHLWPGWQRHARFAENHRYPPDKVFALCFRAAPKVNITVKSWGITNKSILHRKESNCVHHAVI